jgi:Cache 3/Cache 2 fusion domain
LGIPNVGSTKEQSLRHYCSGAPPVTHRPISKGICDGHRATLSGFREPRLAQQVAKRGAHPCNPERQTGGAKVNRKQFVFSTLALGCFVLASASTESVSIAQTDQVKTSMAALQAMTVKLGAPKISGMDVVGGKDAPALYFGVTKMNNSFDLVDELVKKNGGTATLFVKAGEDYVRVATNVKKDDRSRAIGTILDPNGPVFAAIRTGKPYYGDANILGKTYDTGYEPIKDSSGNVIGIYYVGYMKQ